MHRIDTATVSADKFGSGKDGFTNGSPGVTAPTALDDDWFDAVQEELVNSVELYGVTLNKSDLQQLSKALYSFHDIQQLYNWTKEVTTTSFAVDLKGITYGGGFWVAVGENNGTRPQVMASYSGFANSWITRSTGISKNIALNAIAHNGSNLFVAVGNADGSDAYLLTSPDSVTWTERTQSGGGNFALYAVHYANSLWVAVGADAGATSYCVTSSDGTTWTTRTMAIDDTMNGVTYGNSTWVAVGEYNAGDGKISVQTSSDGITWTDRSFTHATSFALNAVDYSETLGLFVAVGGAGVTDPCIFTSPDGITWTQRTVPTELTSAATNGSFEAVCVHNDSVIASGGAQVTNGAVGTVYSIDGITWTLIPGASEDGPDVLDLHSNGQAVFAAVEDDGTSSNVWHTPYMGPRTYPT